MEPRIRDVMDYPVSALDGIEPRLARRLHRLKIGTVGETVRALPELSREPGMGAIRIGKIMKALAPVFANPPTKL
jgi:hypothetical protein